MSIEEIMARMQAIMDASDGRPMTEDEVAEYEGLERDLAAANHQQQLRDRHTAYNTPTGVPGARPAGPGPRPEVREQAPYNITYRDGRSIHRPGGQGNYLPLQDVYDLINKAAGKDLDGARRRVDNLVGQFFNADVERADTDALTPNVYRPDLWQAQQDRTYPLWDLVASGTTDGRSFDVPKFDSSADLVGPATEKTEPAGGSFVVTDQTVTPTQVWGKVEITRQAARRPATPALSGIIWDQMLREFYEDREQAVATFLNTLTAATDITLPGVDASPDNTERLANANALEEALVDLQFVRGGNNFRAFAVHQALYRLLSRVEDSTGRKIYPAIGATNATGTVAPRWRTLDINGTLAIPAWALGAAGGNSSVNSWLFDPAKVRGWSSAPERLDWNFGGTVQTANIPQLSFVTMGIYADVAFANLDIAGVRQVIFDQNTAA